MTWWHVSNSFGFWDFGLIIRPVKLYESKSEYLQIFIFISYKSRWAWYWTGLDCAQDNLWLDLGSREFGNLIYIIHYQTSDLTRPWPYQLNFIAFMNDEWIMNQYNIPLPITITITILQLQLNCTINSDTALTIRWEVFVRSPIAGLSGSTTVQRWCEADDRWWHGGGSELGPKSSSPRAFWKHYAHIAGFNEQYLCSRTPADFHCHRYLACLGTIFAENLHWYLLTWSLTWWDRSLETGFTDSHDSLLD